MSSCSPARAGRCVALGALAHWAAMSVSTASLPGPKCAFRWASEGSEQLRAEVSTEKWRSISSRALVWKPQTTKPISHEPQPTPDNGPVHLGAASPEGWPLEPPSLRGSWGFSQRPCFEMPSIRKDRTRRVSLEARGLTPECPSRTRWPPSKDPLHLPSLSLCELLPAQPHAQVLVPSCMTPH